MGDEIISAKMHNALTIDIGKPKLTKAQEAIMQMINDSLNKTMPITTDIIVKCYCDTMHPTGQMESWVYKFSETHGKRVPHKRFIPVADKYRLKSLANQWFKNNLASCIIKGKLLVLPIIEIES